MITLVWYFLKVIICSGIVCGYYYLVLRNKIFHRWNRFYLLASVILALVVPLMKINIFQKADGDKGTVVKMLQTINSGDEIIIEYSRQRGFQFSSANIVGAVYMLITILFLSVFFIAMYRIFRLKKKYPETKYEGINFITTDAKGTPFSFFNSIFWNNAIDIYSRQGQQIFNHEIAHVKEKHSYDKLFTNVVLIFFWANPFFWLIQKELSMIHEFIADKEALEDNDISSFAEMILQTVYPGKQFSITNNFFHSPLKRRLIMFTKNKNPKLNYLSRLLVLPLAAIVFLAFTLKLKNINSLTNYEGKKITVIIDPGHGGDDNGAVENNTKEKNLNLAIAKEIKLLNRNENINIILSREADESKSVQDRVKFADEKKADLFISIHVDAEENKNIHSGLIIFIPKNDNFYLKESKLLGSALIESFKNNYQLQVTDDLKQREQGIWVLKGNQCPSVLLETGFLSSQSDLEYLINPENQKIIAQNVLNGIEKYAEQNLSKKGNYNSVNTIPTARLNHNKLEERNEVFIDTKNKIIFKADKIINTTEPNKTIVYIPKAVLIVNGKIVNNEVLKDKTITSKILTIHSGDEFEMLNKYGPEAKNGVLVFEDAKIINKPPYPNVSDSKNEPISSAAASSVKNDFINDTIPEKLFTKVENEAEFPGGHEAWIKYIVSKIQLNEKLFKNGDFGTCVVKFIVNTDGSISHVEATTMKESELAKISVDAIKNGPKWIPAKNNDRLVASYRLQPVTLTNPK